MTTFDIEKIEVMKSGVRVTLKLSAKDVERFSHGYANPAHILVEMPQIIHSVFEQYFKEEEERAKKFGGTTYKHDGVIP